MTEKHPVLKLNESLSYQPEAIVSRVLLKNPAGNVTLFAFDAAQELSEHTSPFTALLQVLEGEVEVQIAAQPHPLTAGEAILLPHDQPHAVRALTPAKMLLTMIRG